MRLVGGGVAPRGWLHIVAKLLQCLQFPAWEQPLIARNAMTRTQRLLVTFYFSFRGSFCISRPFFSFVETKPK